MKHRRTSADRSATLRRPLDSLVRKMYRDYQRGLTLAQVAVKHGRGGKHGQQTVWHLFKSRGLKCRKACCSPEFYARRAALRRARLDGVAAAAHADYSLPMPLKAVARKYDTDASTLRRVFARNGLALRPFKQLARQANGSPAPYRPLTARQLSGLIAQATDISIPAALRPEWRDWPLARRGEFIARLRAKVNRLEDRPKLPFSSNVEPFDYASPRAHDIIDRLNAGRDSRTKAACLRLVSQGVIYKDRLYFWAADRCGSQGGAYYIGPWRAGVGRPPLHKIIWEETNGRPMPRGHVIRQIDRNPNNLDPANLILATRNDVCRENQAAALRAKSRAITTLLLNRQQEGKPHANTDTVKALRLAS